jgi:hypothetical protein
VVSVSGSARERGAHREGVDDEGAGAQLVGGRPDLAAGAPRVRADAGDELARRERLRDVVVGAAFEAQHAIGLFAAGRDHEDGRVDVRPRRRRHTSRPSTWGSITSRSTTSGRSRSTSATPSWPFVATVTIIPCDSR